MKSKSTLYSRYFTYIKPIAKLPIIKNYGPTIFSLLTVSILIFFAIKPTIETIVVLQKKLADSEVLLQKVTQKANDLSLGKKNYDNLDQVIKEKIAAAVPDTISLKSIAQTLEDSAETHEASISALQFQPLVVDTKTENQVGSLSEITFTFNIEGSYTNLLALLQDLKTSSRLISLESLSLSKANEDTALIMSLSGKAYYLK
ncbi:type 4a pilus biogenesis protein PilO [Candidatus Daviesbacteria bacterium]|nr:type 4a pilus biogenesis protein PilO [Candidatus Daviesbacteria bacterium]